MSKIKVKIKKDSEAAKVIDDIKKEKQNFKEIVQERNQFLEMDGLFFESETHEWFIDKISTQHAMKKSFILGSGEQDDALDIVCFVVREKSTGNYERVIVDKQTNQPIYSTLSLEDLAYHIDKLKIAKRFK